MTDAATVCAHCYRASCALGVYPCEGWTGQTHRVRVRDLRLLDYEMPVYWSEKYPNERNKQQEGDSGR